MKSQTTTVLLRQPRGGSNSHGHGETPRIPTTKRKPQIVTPVRQNWTHRDNDVSSKDCYRSQKTANTRGSVEPAGIARITMLHPATPCASRPSSSQSLFTQLTRNMGLSSASRWSLNSDDSDRSDSGAASSFDDYVSEITRPGTVRKKGRFIYLTDTDRAEHVGRILRIVPSPTYVAVERAFRPVNFPSLGGPNHSGKLAYLYSDSKKAAAGKRQRTANSISSEVSRPNTGRSVSRFGSASIMGRLTEVEEAGSTRNLPRTITGGASDRRRTISVGDSDFFSERGSV